MNENYDSVMGLLILIEYVKFQGESDTLLYRMNYWTLCVICLTCDLNLPMCMPKKVLSLA
jgi:hypothetical protein